MTTLSRRDRLRVAMAALLAIAAIAVILSGTFGRTPAPVAASPSGEATLYFGSPSELDPARQGDVRSLDAGAY